MDSIIEEILKIDREAQQRIDDAHKQQVSLEEDLQKEKQALLNQLSDRSQQKLQTVYQTEHDYAAQKIQAINQHKQETLQKLDACYQEHHLQWEQALYNRILGR